MKYLLLLVLLAVFLFPLLVLVFYTVSPGWSYPELLPGRVNLRSLSYVAEQSRHIAVSLLSSFVYSILTVLFAFCICFLPASVFARVDFKGKKLLESVSLAPALVPAITFAMGIHFLFIKLGVADSLLGIVLVLTIFSYPYMLRSLTAGFIACSPDYDTCARNLGAGLLFRILHVEIPLILPAIVAGSTVVFLVAFSEYFLVFLIGGGTVPSYTGYLFPFLNSADRAIASLLTLQFMVIPIILFFIIDAVVSHVYKKRSMLGP